MDFTQPDNQAKIQPRKDTEIVDFYQKAAERIQEQRPSSRNASFLEGFLKGLETSLGVTKEPF